MLKIANSEIQAFKRCRRKWILTYVYRLRQIVGGVGALAVGNMFHFPLEHYYAEPNRDPAAFDWKRHLDAYYQERLNDPAFPHDKAPEMQAAYELAGLMLKGYFEWLQAEGSDAEIQIVSAEREVEVILGTVLGVEVHLIGKLDAEIIDRATGFRSFMDHKSVQNLKDLEKIIELNEQLRFYGLLQRLEAAQKQTGEVQFAHGGVLNQARKVKRTASANPPFYGRAGVRHNEDVYRNFYTRVHGEVYEIVRLRQQLEAGVDHQQVAYPTPSRDCSWDCPFLALCPRMDDGSDVQAIIAQGYEVHDPYARYTEVEKG